MEAYFPFQHSFGKEAGDDGVGGPPVNDAGQIYIWRDGDKDEDWPPFDVDSIAGKTSLSEMIQDVISGETCGDGKIREDSLPLLMALRDALLRGVNQLEEAISRVHRDTISHS